MLTPLKSELRDIAPIAYDLEWYPSTHGLRLVGVWDERGYRAYTSVADFLDSEMTYANRGRYFFAHAGGKFDVQFILETVSKNPNYEVAAHFSGSSAVIVKVMQGKHAWTFADSFFLLPDALKKIGKTIGLEKLECAFDAPMAQLKDYNKRDCEIVYEGLLMLQRGLRSLGGEMRATLAASCMNLFRRSYLKQAIPTSHTINDCIRPSYCASRVEVHGRYAPQAEYFDINSSFPFSMTSPQPGALMGIGLKLPKESSPNLWFVDAQIAVYDTDLPPLPYKRKGRIFFPVGAWRGVFTKADIELLEEIGGRILKVYRVWEFEPFDDLNAYVQDIYAKKLAAEKKGDPFERFLYKRVLVSLYGKFGERTTKDKIVVNPEHTTCQHPKPCVFPGGESCIEIVSPGIYRVKEEARVEHAHVPISSYVTSLSRALLYRYMAKAKVRYYCDTDSVVCGVGESLPCSDRLGDLKHEGTVKDAKFLCPKVYAFTVKCEACGGQSKGCKVCHASGEVRTVRSKGFSRMTGETFEKLANYEPVQMDRTRGILEGLREDGGFRMAKSKITEKRLHPDTLPKRRIVGNGTVPWHVEEIQRRV